MTAILTGCLGLDITATHESSGKPFLPQKTIQFVAFSTVNSLQTSTNPPSAAMIAAHSPLTSALSGLNGLLGRLSGRGGATTSQLVPQVRDHADQDTGLNRYDAAKAATLLNDKIASAAGNALGVKNFLSPAGAIADFSPEKVAKNILSFIDSALGFARTNGENPSAMEKKQADAKAAVEKGFAEAKDILQSFGAWSGAVKENAEKTLDLIRQGFADRTSATPQQAVPTQGSAGIQTTSVAAFDASRAETFTMEIKTREGDIVKLSYSAKQSAGFQAGTMTDDNGTRQAVSAYASKSENLSFSVQGDLNDDETQAIANLMKGVDKLAQDFYGGDLQGAMQHAMALDMNGDQLSGVSLDLSYTQSRSAISAYQQVGGLDRNKGGQAPLNNRETAAIGDFNKNLEGLLREMDRFFQDTDKLVKSLFHNLSPEPTRETSQETGTNTLQDLLNGLIGAASNRQDREKAAISQPSA